jgi:hypothetical protein
MLTITEIAGFAGAGLAGAAYVPQISHLVRARCSAGISRLAFGVWLLAALLITARAIAIHAGVFIVLGGVQIVATALIMLYAARYQDTPCPVHRPLQPTATTATGIGHSGNEPDSWRPPGRPVAGSAAAAGHSGALRVDGLAGNRMSGPSAIGQGQEIAAAVPCANVARPGRSRPCTGFQTTHLRGTT